MATIGAVLAGLTGLAAYFYGPPAQRTITKMGVFREHNNTLLRDPADLVILQDTVQCEDLHYYAPANKIFTACEDTYDLRFQWFPPLGLFEGADLAWKAQGSIHIIDPETKESKRLSLEAFDGPFITHGIDVIDDPARPGEAVYIFAVNHVPNEAVFPRDGSTPSTDPATAAHKAASRLEQFHHVLGTAQARHVRTIAHPLIQTPNDIYAASPTAVYVSNDHHYREGRMRLLEDLYPGAAWSNVVYATTVADEDDGRVEATVALDGLHNPNGMGHGRTADELVVASAVGGYYTVVDTRRLNESSGGTGAAATARIDFDSTVDNPTWFVDAFADEASAHDKSGFVQAGLPRGVDFFQTAQDPLAKEGVIVWHATPCADAPDGWAKRILWQDDGSVLRNAATAVLVGIDPATEGGAKRAWLFVSGFSSRNAVAVKVDL